MRSLRSILRSWKQDQLFMRVVGNSTYMFASNAISAVLSIVSAGLLGVTGFGKLGIITGFAVTINNLLSFRMSDVVVKYMGEALAHDEKERAGAVIKAAGMMEVLISLAAYGILLLLAPLGAKYIARDPALTPLFLLYGGIILANLVTETSTGILRVIGHFRSLALVNLLQSVLVAVLIVIAAAGGGDLEQVLWAYLIGKLILGLGPVVLAVFWLPRTLGKRWWRASLSKMPPLKEFFRFAISTNFSGTINIIARDSEVQWLGFFFGPQAAGYFKVAIALIGLIIMPIDPFISTTYPEITRAYARRRWSRLRSLIARVTAISFTWTATVAVGLVLLGRQLLFSNLTIFGHSFHIYKPEYLPAFPILMILLAGYGFANTLFWNRSLLLAQGRADEALWISFFSMLAKVGLAIVILPHAPYIVEAFLLSGYFIVSVSIQVWRGVTKMEQDARAEPVPLPDLEKRQSLQKRIPTAASATKSTNQHPRLVNRWDWLAALVFLIYAGWYCLGRLEGNYPRTILSGDGGNIASYAAAQDHPEWFSIDPALGQADNTGIYATVQIPLIRLIENWTGDYGQAYAWLVLPTIFLQLLGFYILGRVMFKDQLWAFLLAFLNAMMVINFGLGEIWGVWRDALPRVTFQAVLPFLLALVLAWKSHPKRWVWIMLLAGLMVYLHPISAPAWGFAIWLSLWVLLPADWGILKRCLLMLGLGTAFLLPLLPYAANYLTYQARGQTADLTTVMTVLQEYSPDYLLQPWAALGAFLLKMTRNLLLPLAVLGFTITWLLRKGSRRPIVVVLLWMAGIFVVSILVPSIERIIEARLQLLPIETELVRCLRYFIPLMLLFWIWPLAELTPRLKNVQARRVVLAVGVILFGYWGSINRPDLSAMLRVVTCVSRGELICDSARPIDELLEALRTKTQPGEGVLFFNEDPAYTSQTISVRYAALRPLVYTERDSGLLGYANRSLLQGWLATTREWEAVRAVNDPVERLAALVPLADRLGATYLVVDYPVPAEIVERLPASVLFKNDTYLVLKLH